MPRGVHLKILISWQARVSEMKCRFRGAGGWGGTAPPPVAHQIQRLESTKMEKQKIRERRTAAKAEKQQKQRAEKQKHKKQKSSRSRKAAKAEKAAEAEKQKQKSNNSKTAAEAETQQKQNPKRKKHHEKNASPLHSHGIVIDMQSAYCMPLSIISHELSTFSCKHAILGPDFKIRGLGSGSVSSLQACVKVNVPSVISNLNSSSPAAMEPEVSEAHVIM